MHPTCPVIGFPIGAESFERQVERIVDWARRGESRVVCAANVHMLMEGRQRPAFAEILRSADLLTPDGMPLVWLMRLLGRASQERVPGMDLMPRLCERSEREGLGAFFLGSTPEVLEAMRARLQLEYPRLRIAGMASPPFRALTAQEDEKLVAAIHESGAALTFVAMGCPKQECWMHEHRGRLRSVMVGVGAAFPVYARTQAMAPQLLRDAGMEWAFRLFQEPRRLGPRYLKTNLPFLGLAIRQLAGRL